MKAVCAEKVRSVRKGHADSRLPLDRRQSPPDRLLPAVDVCVRMSV